MTMINLENIKRAVENIEANEGYKAKKTLTRYLGFKHLLIMADRGIIDSNFKMDTKNENTYLAILSRVGDYIKRGLLVEYNDISEDLMVAMYKAILNKKAMGNGKNKVIKEVREEDRYNTGIFGYLSFQKTCKDKIVKKNTSIKMLLDLSNEESKIHDMLTDNVGSICLGKAHTLLMELHRIYSDMRFLKICATGELSKRENSSYKFRTKEIMEIIKSGEISITKYAKNFKLDMNQDFDSLDVERFLYVDLKHIIEIKKSFSLKESYKLLQYWYNSKIMYDTLSNDSSEVNNLKKIFKK